MKKTIPVLALALASSAAFADNNLVANGSFELGTVPAANTWAPEGSVPGWTIGDPWGLELRNNVAGTAQDGSIFAELDGAANMSISQTIATTAGQAYSFSFWYSDRPGTAGATDGLSFSAGGLSGTIAGNDNGTGDNVWHQYTGVFVATGSSTTLTFAGTGISDGYGTSLDNVSVTSAVPEPASMGLMAAGLALLGVVRRRRRD